MCLQTRITFIAILLITLVRKVRLPLRILTKVTPLSLAGLHFIWPLKGPITQGFNGALNKGIDIATNKGTPIKAAEKGKVIYSGPVTGYGYILILSHNSKNTVLSVYSHATGLRVKLGNQVQKGDILALLEGNSFHFEIRQDGQAINPVPYLY